MSNPINNRLPLIGSMPILRHGDQVFIINQPPKISWEEERRREWELEAARKYDYCCPFSIIDDFPRWFEWHKRVHFGKERTADIILSMLFDLGEIKKYRIEKITYRAFHAYNLVIHDKRACITGSFF